MAPLALWIGFTGGVANPLASDEAEVSSLIATLEDVHRRVGDMAVRLAGESAPREDVVAALYEAERSVSASIRSVTKARRQMT